MALIDAQNAIADALAVTTTSITDVIDLNQAAPQYAGGEDLLLVCKVNTTFAGGTSLRAVLWTDDTVTVTSGVDIISGDVLTVANNQLDAGENLLTINLKNLKLQQYIGIQFVVVGTMSAGKVDAQLQITADSGMPAVS